MLRRHRFGRQFELGIPAEAFPAILADLRAARMGIVTKPERFTPGQLATNTLHPRLQQPMSAVDLAFFVAEHDDHHLARIT